ncbi:MAG TPA: PhzF family phenazine biosynthesis protein [Chitinophagales bacterium]|nr:PhzF family phenazine biosynthesis protein [Chitinophagales bacterium]
MKLPIFQVDAFTDKLFGGNPAAVVPLNNWLPDETMQSIAAENNLSETAFFISSEEDYDLRWFTPAVEVPLCGHATLAAAHVMFHHMNYVRDEIRFHSQSGLLKVRRDGDWITLDFPADAVKRAEAPENLVEALKVTPKEIWKGKENYLIVLNSAEEVYNTHPDFVMLKAIGGHGFVITSKGNDTDFISRYFVPSFGINEDPVTGYAHCALIPYWSNVLEKNEMRARQVSKRGGYLKCKLNGDRVEISGQAVTYLTGDIVIGH